MSEREVRGVSALLNRDVSRRDALKALAGGGIVLGAGKATDNVLLGYGTVVGTNLLAQDLAAMANRDFHPGGGAPTLVDGYEMDARRDAITFRGGAGVAAEFVPGRATAADGQRIDEELGLDGVATQLTADLGAIDAGEHTFAFSQFEPFVERVRGGETRPHTVDALRGFSTDVDADLVQRFSGAAPQNPPAVLRGLVGGFRRRAFYDVPRYVAGSIQFNILMDTVDVRAPFRHPVDYESLLDGEGKTGMFCYEFTQRGIEAVHAIPAHEQRLPVMAARVVDTRHRHVYLGVASVVREDGDLVVPMTFVDYTHTTLYDDLNLRGIMGEGFEAYNDRHRTTGIDWDPYPN